MKREDIKKLFPAAEDALIDQVMDLHSADVGGLKQSITTLTTERDTLKTQLDAANNEIKGFKDLDIDGIKQRAADWETKYNTDTQALKDQLAAQAYGHSVEQAVSAMHFSSGSAKKQFISDLTAKKLPLQDGKLLGLDDYVKEYKEADPDAFAPENDGKTPTFVKGGSGGAGVGDDAALRAAFGLTDKKD